ncbi:hypothetical protein Dip518_001335 [Parelusimicrobium proximum]|uniref:hypothetical protein n=1 Tax=Parelusimicrobium proximum TaxID=3228953 RepID=UPI003D17F02A
MKKIFAAAVGILILTVSLSAEALRKDAYLIDTPTADVIEQYGAEFTTRLYSENSVMQSVDFGVYPGLNIGMSFAVQNLIGSEWPMRALTPAMQLKFKLYDGSLYLPAIAIGYDGRRFGYDRASKEYKYDEKGAYLVLSREVFIPNLQINPGVNVSDFDKSDVFFFVGGNFNIEDKVNIMLEWDNVHTIDSSRLNTGLRVYLSEQFVLDFAGRDLTHKNDIERIVQLKYTVNF